MLPWQGLDQDMPLNIASKNITGHIMMRDKVLPDLNKTNGVHEMTEYYSVLRSYSIQNIINLEAVTSHPS